MGDAFDRGAEAAEPQLLTDLAHHEAYKALCRYALEQTGPRRKVKPHDLMIEALEDWFAKNDLNNVLVRAKPRAAQLGRL